MIGLVMAGGKGSRMHLQDEKLLLKHIHPTILHVVFALQKSDCFSKITALTSPHSPKTKKILQNTSVEIFETPGNGFVYDLNLFLKSVNEEVLVVPGDLPLFNENIVSSIVKEKNPDTLWRSYLVTKDFLTSLGLKSEFSTTFQNKECCFTGISIINAKEINNLNSVKENFQILNDKRIAFNLNTMEDYNLLSTT